MNLSEQCGGCACGAVTFRAKAPKTYGICHCEMCRRWTGGAWMGVQCNTAEFSGPIKVWQSSRIAKRGFCGSCGSSVYHWPKNAKGPTIGQGLFFDQSGWTLTREIMANERPEPYGIDRGVAQPVPFTGWGTLWAYLLGRLPK